MAPGAMEVAFIVLFLHLQVAIGHNTKPNFVLILADDLGYNDLGYNNPAVKTPVLDQLAEEGVKLTQAYGASGCSPSRAALLTGYYPHRYGFQHNVVRDLSPQCLPFNVDLFPERLQELGYQTSLLGKWHMGYCREECLPTSRGFHRFHGFWTGANTYYSHQAGFGPLAGHDWINGTEIDKSSEGEFMSDIMTRDAVRILDEHAQNKDNFFMFLSYYNPHSPLEVSEEYEEMYADNSWGTSKRAKYLGLVTNLDDQISVVVDKLKETNLYDNTLILFASDNGGASSYGDNSPYRGAKSSQFEGGVRVPAFFHGPGVLHKSGYSHPGMFHFSDIGETLLSIAGGDTGTVRDGVDQSDMILRGGPSKRNRILHQINMHPMGATGQAAYRLGDMKLIWGPFGYADGYGKDAIEYYRDPVYLAMVNATQTTLPGEGYPLGYLTIPNQQDIQVMMKLDRIWRFNPEDINSGVVFFFNITADPEERNNLADDPMYGSMILDMKRTILDILKTDEYSPPTPDQLDINQGAAPSNYPDNSFHTGWCPDSDFLMPSAATEQISSGEQTLLPTSLTLVASIIMLILSLVL